MSALAITALAILAWALIFAAVLAVGMLRYREKPTPPAPPGSVQARIDALRALGDEVDEMFPGPGEVPHWRGGWRN
jgi:hypothetical protein